MVEENLRKVFSFFEILSCSVLDVLVMVLVVVLEGIELRM